MSKLSPEEILEIAQKADVKGKVVVVGELWRKLIQAGADYMYKKLSEVPDEELIEDIANTKLELTEWFTNNR